MDFINFAAKKPIKAVKMRLLIGITLSTCALESTSYAIGIVIYETLY